MTFAERTHPDYRPVSRDELRERRKQFRLVSGKVLHAPVRPADEDEVVDTRLSPEEIRTGLARVAEMRARIADVQRRSPHVSNTDREVQP